MQATYEYAARGKMPAVKLTWYQGVNKPQVWLDKKIPQWGDGVLFIGEKGMLLSNYDKHQLLPEKDFEGFKPPEPFIPNSIGHHEEWIQAAKTDLKTTCNFEYSGWLTEANHLGNVAYRAAKKLEWDAAAMFLVHCTGRPSANSAPIREETTRATKSRNCSRSASSLLTLVP